MSVTTQPVNFLKEVRSELTKVSWSTRQEVFGATLVVIMVTAILVVYIFIIDVALARFLSAVFR